MRIPGYLVVGFWFQTGFVVDVGKRQQQQCYSHAGFFAGRFDVEQSDDQEYEEDARFDV